MAVQICPKCKSKMTIQKAKEGEIFVKSFLCEKCGYKRRIEGD